MAKAVNQNDLIDIIKSQVDSLGDIMTVVFKAVDKKSLKVSGDIEAKMQKFKHNMDMVYGPKGILTVISNVKLQNIKPISIKDKWKAKMAIKRAINLMDSICKDIPFVDPTVKMRINQLLKHIQPLNNLIETLNSLIENLKKLKLKDLISIWWKGILLRRAIKMIGKLARSISLSFATVRLSPRILLKITTLREVVEKLQDIMSLIRGTKTMFVSFKIKSIIKIFRPLQRLINRINRLRRVNKAMRNILKMAILVAALKSMVTNLLILVPLLILLMILSPVLILGFLALSMVLKVIKMISRTTLGVSWAIKRIALIVILLAVCGIALIVLGILAPLLLAMLPSIGLFFLGLIVVVLILAVMGLIFKLVAPVLTSLVIGILVMTLVVFCIWIMVKMLEDLANIKLDHEKIKDNVKAVIDTVLNVFNWLFETEINEIRNGEDNWFVRILKGLGGAAMKVVGVLLSCIILIVSVIVVFCILAIAGMLFLIQKIDLDYDLIKENVEDVIKTVKLIMELVFQPDDQQSKPSDKGFLGDLLDWAVGEGMTNKFYMVIDAIIAMAYIAVMMISVLCILLLAGMLWLLQKINLDYTLIEKNVETVIKTCHKVMDLVFKSSVPEDNPSEKGWIRSVFDWAFGEGVMTKIMLVVDAILALAYIAVLTVCVLLIYALAWILKGIENIDLNETNVKKIEKNVKAVLNTCHLVMNEIFKDDDTESKESDKGWLIGLADFVSPTLGNIMKIVDAVLAMAYLAVLVISMLFIFALAWILTKLAEYDFNDQLVEKIKSNIEKIIEVAKYTNNVINEPIGDIIKDDDPWYEDIIVFGATFIKGVAQVAEAIVNCIFIAISIVSALLIMLLLEVFGKLSTYSINSTYLENLISDTISVAKTCTDAIHNASKKIKLIPEQNDDEQGFLSSIIGFIFEDSPWAAAVKSILWVMAALGSIGIILILAKALEPLSKIKLSAGITSAVQNTINTTTYINNLIYKLMWDTKQGKAREINTKHVGVFTNWVKDVITPILTDMIGIQLLLKTFDTSFADENYTNNIKNAAVNLINLSTDLLDLIRVKKFDMVRVDRNLNLFEKTARIFKMFSHVSATDVENSKKITENYIKFIDKINASDFQKLDIAAKMFESFAILAESIKGDFQGLAETVNEHIMPVLDETQKMLDALPGELEKAGDRMSQELESAATTAGQRMAEALNSITIQTSAPVESESISTPVATNPNNTSTDYQKTSTKWKYDSMQDIVDIMMGAGGGVRVRNI